MTVSVASMEWRRFHQTSRDYAGYSTEFRTRRRKTASSAAGISTLNEFTGAGVPPGAVERAAAGGQWIHCQGAVSASVPAPACG